MSCGGASLADFAWSASPKVVLPICFLFRVARDLGLDFPIANPYTVPPTPWNPEVSTVSHTKSEKEKLLNRVKRVRGQIEAVERALEEEKGCSTVLHLIVAARGAMSSLMTEVIEDHIRLHVVDPIKGTERVRGAEELIEAVQAYLK
jgi:DNA-binding FrmR family transcriptional regulator